MSLASTRVWPSSSINILLKFKPITIFGVLSPKTYISLHLPAIYTLVYTYIFWKIFIKTLFSPDRNPKHKQENSFSSVFICSFTKFAFSWSFFYGTFVENKPSTGKQIAIATIAYGIYWLVKFVVLKTIYL